MKKITLMLVSLSFALMSSTTLLAQRININSFKEIAAKHDADVENPKKNIKAATWLKRADAYYSIGKEPVKQLYEGVSIETIKTAFGKERGHKKVTLGGQELDEWTYYFVTVYATPKYVVSWKITRDIIKAPFDTARNSYAKAAEIDPSVMAKAEAGLEKIANHYREMGNIAGKVENYDLAANSYLSANTALTAIDKSKNDANLLYLAGYLFTINGAKNPRSYGAGERRLYEAVRAGYNKIEDKDTSIADEDRGRAYYYYYYCVMNGTGELTTKRLVHLKNYMIKAVAEYPKNANLMSFLMNLYATHPEIGTHEEVLEMINKALAQNPDNISVWYSRGRVYADLKQYDECIKSFENVVRLDPEGFNGYFYIGLFYTSLADEYNEVMKEKTYTKQVEYDADFKLLCDKYKESLPYLEKAISIKPEDATTLEYLKSIYFRLREEEGMMDKYNMYNERYNKLSAAE